MTTTGSTGNTVRFTWEFRRFLPVKRLIVNSLERACCLLHWVPGYYCQLALWSARLDERWGTEEWKETP